MAGVRRGRGARPDSPRKDRVLHARIPEGLDEHLRRRAERLGLSVSTLVRNVLMHSLDLVEDVVTDSAQMARALGRARESRGREPRDRPAQEPAAAQTLAWQEAVLNLNGVCERCNALLPAGTRAGVGVPTGLPPRFLCGRCLEELTLNAERRSPSAPARRTTRRRSS